MIRLEFKSELEFLPDLLKQLWFVLNALLYQGHASVRFLNDTVLPVGLILFVLLVNLWTILVSHWLFLFLKSILYNYY